MIYLLIIGRRGIKSIIVPILVYMIFAIVLGKLGDYIPDLIAGIVILIDAIACYIAIFKRIKQQHSIKLRTEYFYVKHNLRSKNINQKLSFIFLYSNKAINSIAS